MELYSSFIISRNDFNSIEYTLMLQTDTLKFQERNPRWMYPKIAMRSAVRGSWEILPSDIAEQGAAGKVINSNREKLKLLFYELRITYIKK